MAQGGGSLRDSPARVVDGTRMRVEARRIVGGRGVEVASRVAVGQVDAPLHWGGGLSSQGLVGRINHHARTAS